MQFSSCDSENSMYVAKFQKQWYYLRGLFLKHILEI